jgi:Ca2+-binding RTX toxin-like protein
MSILVGNAVNDAIRRYNEIIENVNDIFDCAEAEADAGNDRVYGQTGDDVLDGGEGRDTIWMNFWRIGNITWGIKNSTAP